MTQDFGFEGSQREEFADCGMVSVSTHCHRTAAVVVVAASLLYPIKPT